MNADSILSPKRRQTAGNEGKNNSMNGIINIYKEAGYTSFDVVAKLRGILKVKKIGHTGTLDPQAVGVLPVCIGSATKVCALLTDKDKEYEAVLRLGLSTDTQDATGAVLQDRSHLLSELKEAQVREAVLGFIGDYDQTPPMYSALKVNGKKLCDLAREGVEVERKSRRVHIYSIEILDICIPLVTMRVHCSKGTYIRTLCDDIGECLGVGGRMEHLVRTRVSGFRVESAVTLAQVEEHRDNGTLDEILLPVDCVFEALPALHVKEQAFKRLQNGNRLRREDFFCKEAGESCVKPHTDGNMPIEDMQARVYGDGKFYGIYRYDKDRGDYACEKLFV